MTTSTKGCLALAHADVFQKNEKKNETTSVYRLTFSTFTHTPGFYLGYWRRRSFPGIKMDDTVNETVFIP